MKTERIKTDILIIGGGTAGCYAAIPESEYTYGGVPVINGRGFEVLAKSDDEIQKFLKEYSETAESDHKSFFAKWVKFDIYRKVIFSGLI